MATITVPRKLEILQERSLSVVDLAALTVASKPFAKVKSQLEPGDHKVYAKVLLTGGVTLGNPVPTKTPADALGVLAFVLARLPANQRAAVAAAVASPGFAVTKADREAAREICSPTQRPTMRAGALTGVVEVDLVR